MPEMTQEQRGVLRRLLAQATRPSVAPAPWTVHVFEDDDDGGEEHHLDDATGSRVADLYHTVADDKVAELIAAAVNALPAFLDMADALDAAGKREAALRAVLARIADPDLAGKTWQEVVEAQRLDWGSAAGESFCGVMYTQWGYANMARIVLSGVTEDCPVCGGTGGRFGRGECPACDGKGKIQAALKQGPPATEPPDALREMDL